MQNLPLDLWLSPSTSLRDHTGRDVLFGNKKDLLVLAYLALASPASVSRLRLAHDCWPGASTERARGSLRTSLHSLRAHLGDRLETDRETARLCPGALKVWVEPGVFMPEFTEPWVRMHRIRWVQEREPGAEVHPVLPAIDYLAEKNPGSAASLLAEAADDLEFLPMAPVLKTVSRLRERLIQVSRPTLGIEALYYHYREAAGLPHASETILSGLLHDATRSGDRRSAIRFLLLLSCRSVSTNDYERSLSHLRQAQRLAAESKDPFLAILCRLYAGITFHHGGSTKAAAENDRKLVELVDRRGSDEWLARVSPLLGVSSDLTQDEWQPFFHHVESQRVTNHRVAGLPLLTAAWISLAQKNTDQAREYTAEAHLALASGSGSPGVNVLDLLAAIATAERDPQSGAAFYHWGTQLRGDRQRSWLEQQRTARVREALHHHPVWERGLPPPTEDLLRHWLDLPTQISASQAD